MPEQPDDIQVKITYHRQRSSTAKINDGKIILRISTMVSRRIQQQHIDYLIGKLKTTWKKHRKKIPLTLMRLLKDLAYRKCVSILLSTGVEYEIVLKRADISKIRVKKTADIVYLLVPVDCSQLDLRQAEKALWKFLAIDQVPIVEHHLKYLCEGWIEESFETVRLRMVSSRWGSCDKRRGIIMLSLKLLLIDPKLFDYVCIHELAHLRYADHSDLFWDLVARKLPDWKIRRKRMREFE